MPQDTSLAFDYTVLEIVLMGRYPHLGAFEVEGPRDIAVRPEALEATGTAAFAERPFRTLSGGEKQRVIIASALAQLDAGYTGPGRLLRFSARRADGVAGSAVSARDRRAPAAPPRRAGITILLSTHDLRLAAAVCTRLVLLARAACSLKARRPRC